jgi:DNA-binding transcriptional ArsR family regulator
MSDIFKALANPKARLVIETLAKTPSSTVVKLAEASKVSSDQVTTHLATLVESGLVRSTGSGTSKKYSINAKGFTPYVAWFAKVAESQAMARLEKQVTELGGKVGSAVSTGTNWVADQVTSKVDINPKKLGNQLGKMLADVKVEAQKEVKGVKKDAKKIAKSIKARIKAGN